MRREGLGPKLARVAALTGEGPRPARAFTGRVAYWGPNSLNASWPGRREPSASMKCSHSGQPTGPQSSRCRSATTLWCSACTVNPMPRWVSWAKGIAHDLHVRGVVARTPDGLVGDQLLAGALGDRHALVQVALEALLGLGLQLAPAAVPHVVRVEAEDVADRLGQLQRLDVGVVADGQRLLVTEVLPDLVAPGQLRPADRVVLVVDAKLSTPPALGPAGDTTVTSSLRPQSTAGRCRTASHLPLARVGAGPRLRDRACRGGTGCVRWTPPPPESPIR
jgi:hypothetical protein